MSIPCVVINTTSGEIVNNNYTISEENAVAGPSALGLDPSLKVLIKYEPFARPEVDFRYFTLNEVKDITTEAHPIYPLYDVYKTTYTTTKRPTEEIKQVAENAEVEALYRLFPSNRQILELALGVAVLFRRAEGMQLNQTEQALASRLIAQGQKIWQNRAVLKQKITAIEAGQEPDLEEGYDREPVA